MLNRSYKTLNLRSIEMLIASIHAKSATVTILDSVEYTEDATPTIHVTFRIEDLIGGAAATYVGDFWLERDTDESMFLYGEW